MHLGTAISNSSGPCTNLVSNHGQSFLRETTKERQSSPQKVCYCEGYNKGVGFGSKTPPGKNKEDNKSISSHRQNGNKPAENPKPSFHLHLSGKLLIRSPISAFERRTIEFQRLNFSAVIPLSKPFKFYMICDIKTEELRPSFRFFHMVHCNWHNDKGARLYQPRLISKTRIAKRLLIIHMVP